MFTLRKRKKTQKWQNMDGTFQLEAETQASIHTYLSMNCCFPHKAVRVINQTLKHLLQGAEKVYSHYANYYEKKYH